jgi:hypothetical protein
MVVLLVLASPDVRSEPLGAGARPVHPIRVISRRLKFGRFWSEADIELRLSSGLTAQKPTAMTITPSKIKNPLSWIIF